MAEEEDFTKLSIEDRCTHKVWKARLSGYEAAANFFRQIDDEKSSDWNKFIPLAKKFVVDSNAPAQEKGLEAVLVLVENCASAGKTAGDVMAGLVQKCISAPKARTKELAAQISLMYIEIEKHEIVLDELIKGTESKNPKIVSGSIHIINLSLNAFGAKVVNISKILKLLKLLEDRDKGVRDEMKLLLVEIYRWLGPAIKPQLSMLKPVQMSEMEAEFVKIKEVQARPARLLRSHQLKKEKIGGSEAGENDEDDEVDKAAEEIDPYDLLDPVDILSQLPKNFFSQLEEKKWTERKDALEALDKLLTSSPKIENADYGDLIRALKKIIAKDSNIVVTGISIKCVTGLANGLKKKFHPYATVMMSTLFEKFKEKKQNVVLALRDAVDAIYPSTSLELLLDDILTNLDNKNPSVKSEIASFLARCFTKSTPTVLNKKLLKPLVKSLLKCLSDQDPSVRDNAAQAIGTAMKVVTEKVLSAFLVDVDNTKMAKIKECYDKAEIVAKQPKPVRQPKAKPAPAAISSASVVKPKVVKSARKSLVFELEQGQIEALRDDIIPASIIKGISSPDASTRLEAFEQLSQLLPELQVAMETGQILLKTIACENPETNIDVLKVKLNLEKLIVNTMPVSEESVASSLVEVASSLVYPECNDLAGETLWAFASKCVSLEFLLEPVLKNDIVQRDPKVWAEMLNWVSSAIMKTGLVYDSNYIIDCGKQALSNPNSVVKNAGLALIGTVHLHPQPVRSKPTKSASTDSVPQSNIKKTSSTSSMLSNEVKKEKSSPTDGEARVDIGPQLTEQLIAELSDKNWKVRAEAIAKIQTIVTSAGNITSNLGEAAPAIAARISDSNTKISASAVTLVESLANAIGPQCKTHLRIFLPFLIKAMGDQKPWIRTAAITCVNKWGDMGGYKEFFEGEVIADALKAGSPVLRTELWAWLSEKLPIIPPKTIPKDELTTCLPTLYSNIEDRSAEVRKNACEATLGFMIHLGFTTMMSACDNIKGSGGTQVKQFLEKTRGNLPERPTIKKEKSTVQSGKQLVSKLAPGSSATITIKPKPKVGAPKSAGARKKVDEEDTSPLFQVNNFKHQRLIDEQKLKTLKWNFSSPRPEFVELLKEQMINANMNKSLIGNMFHNDFKYHLKAIDAMTDDLNINRAALICNLDLILKWMTLRFFDTNPSVLLKGLEYLNSVFIMLIEEDYSLLECEAYSFFPYLTIKAGDPKDAVRVSVRNLFKQLVSMYPKNKQFQFLMDGVKSKNARQRAECLEQMCWLITEFDNMDVCYPSPQAALKEIAKFIADRDTGVRNAALNLVVAAYFLEGEKVLKTVSQISDKDLSLLEERIKRAKLSRPYSTGKPQLPVTQQRVELQEPETEAEVQDQYEYEEQRPNSSPPGVPPSVPDYQKYLQHQPRAQINTPQKYTLDQGFLDEIESINTSFRRPQLHEVDVEFLQSLTPSVSSLKPIQMPKMTPSLSNYTQPNAIKWELAQIASSDIEKALASIKQIDTILNSDKRFHLSGFVNQMADQLVHNLIILNQSAHSEVVNCYNTNFTLLQRLAGYPSLCNEISENTLYKLVEQLLLLLCEKRPDSLEKNDMFTKAVNVVVLHILENSNKTNIMCALIRMLYGTVNNPQMESHFSDLVVKSLWKLNRTLHEWDSDLDYVRLLMGIHNFLKEFPTSWWKTQEVDLPLRTVKTILHSMVKIRGVEVREVIRRIPSVQPDSELLIYVKKVIKHLKIEETHQVAPAPQAEKKGRTPVAPNFKISKEARDDLTDIFTLIGDSEKTHEGVRRLYLFKKKNPAADIQPFLNHASPVFRDYILKGLAKIESEYNDEKNQMATKQQNADIKNQDNQQRGNNKFNKEVERLWDRLHHLQEKAGCHVEKDNNDVIEEEITEKTPPKEETTETYDPHLQSIKERFELIKTNIS